MDSGIAETNDPRVRVPWVREGRTVRLGLLVDEQPEPKLCTSLPPTARGTGSASLRS